MNDIVFIHGAYHGTWCWKPDFLRVFKKKGYKTYCTDIKTSCKKEKSKTLLENYADNLFQFVRKLEGKTILVVHSAYSIVVLEYIKKYSETVEMVIFISPLPVRLEFPRVLFSGIKQLMLGKKRVYFSDRLSNQKAEEYLGKFSTEEGRFTIETSQKHWKNKDKFPVPALLIGSKNDNCIKAEWVTETAMKFGCESMIYRNLCHEMMLDPDNLKLAEDILKFIEKGEETKKYGETGTVY